MALSRSQIRQLRDSLSFNSNDVSKIADALYGYKVTVYENTLSQFARDYQRSELPGLSADVRRALQSESLESGQVIADSFNADVLKFIEANRDVDPQTLLDRVDVWARNRATGRRDKVAVTETYGPHADALLGIFAANGIDAEFDFGGHGDDDPACPLCKVIVARNPHPLARALKIGNPHIQCRQLWHPRIEAEDLPPVMTLEPARVAGIVGGGTLLQRKNTMKSAIRYVNRLK